jgi:hypothetical protein
MVEILNVLFETPSLRPQANFTAYRNEAESGRQKQLMLNTDLKYSAASLSSLSYAQQLLLIW